MVCKLVSEVVMNLSRITSQLMIQEISSDYKCDFFTVDTLTCIKEKLMENSRVCLISSSGMHESQLNILIALEYGFVGIDVRLYFGIEIICKTMLMWVLSCFGFVWFFLRVNFSG